MPPARSRRGPDWLTICAAGHNRSGFCFMFEYLNFAVLEHDRLNFLYGNDISRTFNVVEFLVLDLFLRKLNNLSFNTLCVTLYNHVRCANHSRYNHGHHHK